MLLREKDFTARVSFTRAGVKKSEIVRPVSGGHLWTNTAAFNYRVDQLEQVEQQGYGTRLQALGAWMALRFLRATWSTGDVVDGTDTAVAAWLNVSRTTWSAWRSTLEQAGLLGIGLSGTKIVGWADLEGRKSDGKHRSGGHAVTDRQTAHEALSTLLSVAGEAKGGGAARGYAAWGAWWLLVVRHMRTGGFVATNDRHAADLIGVDRRSWQRLSQLLVRAGLLRREGTSWHVAGAQELHGRRPALRQRKQGSEVVHRADSGAPNLRDIPAPNLDNDQEDSLTTRACTRAGEIDPKPSPTPQTTRKSREPRAREGSKLSPSVIELLERVSDAVPEHATECRTSSGLKRALRELIATNPESELAAIARELTRDLDQTWNPVGVVVFRARQLAADQAHSDESQPTGPDLRESSTDAKQVTSQVEIRQRLDREAAAHRHQDLSHEIAFGLDELELRQVVLALDAVIDRPEPAHLAQQVLAWCAAVVAVSESNDVVDSVRDALRFGFHQIGPLGLYEGSPPLGERELIARLSELEAVA